MTQHAHPDRKPPRPTNVFRMEAGGIVEAVPLDGTDNPEVALPATTIPCPKYFPGHNVHPIQAKLAFQVEPVPITIVSVAGKRITYEYKGEKRVGRNHRPEVIKEILRQYGKNVPAWIHGHGVFSCQGYLFSMECRFGSRFKPWRPCT